MNAGIQTSTSNCAKTIIDVQQTHRSPSLHERWHSNIDEQLRFVNAGIQRSTINCAKSIINVQQIRGLPSLHERWHSKIDDQRHFMNAGIRTSTINVTLRNGWVVECVGEQRFLDVNIQKPLFTGA